MTRAQPIYLPPGALGGLVRKLSTCFRGLGFGGVEFRVSNSGFRNYLLYVAVALGPSEKG